MSKQTRLKPEIRKDELLAAAVALAADIGYTQITREQVASAAGVTPNALSYHFNTMPQFRRELMRFAVRRRNALVVAQGLALRDPHAMRADEDLKIQAQRALY